MTPSTVEIVQTRIEREQVKLPSAMKDCGERPRVPEGVDVDPKPGADYVAALADWGDTCRARLRGVAGIIDAARDAGGGRR